MGERDRGRVRNNKERIFINGVFKKKSFDGRDIVK